MFWLISFTPHIMSEVSKSIQNYPTDFIVASGFVQVFSLWICCWWWWWWWWSRFFSHWKLRANNLFPPCHSPVRTKPLSLSCSRGSCVPGLLLWPPMALKRLTNNYRAIHRDSFRGASKTLFGNCQDSCRLLAIPVWLLQTAFLK